MQILRMAKCSKISKTFLFLFLKEMLVIKAGIHKTHVKTGNREDLQTFFRSSLIRVCTVCLDIFCSKLVFEILEHLPYHIYPTYSDI